MKIAINENSVDMDRLKTKLEEHFSNYKFSILAKNVLVGAKSNTIGVNVVIKKANINVVANFPTMGGRILFALSIFLLGILIPIIIYFIAFHPRMKAFEKEIAAYVQEEFGIKS